MVTRHLGPQSKMDSGSEIDARIFYDSRFFLSISSSACCLSYAATWSSVILVVTNE